jgi:glutaredoxin
MYEIYTFTTCEHCHAAMKLMKEKGIPFEQIDAGSSEGTKRFTEFYSKYRSRVARGDDGCAIMPILIDRKGENVNIHQGTDGLEKFLGV